MKTDIYLKVVLTVIALALVALVFQNSKTNLITLAHAQPNKMDVNIVSVGGNSTWGGALPVSISDKVKVEVANSPTVKLDVGYNGLDVRVKNVREFSGTDVNVKNYRDFK